MPRTKQQQTAIPGFGFIFQPVYVYRGEKRRSSIWWIQYQIHGEIVRRSTGFDNAPDALNELMKLAGRKASGDLIDASPERCTFDVLFDLLESDYHRRKRSTTDDMIARVNKHLRPVFGSSRVQSLKKHDVDAFVASRLNGFEVMHDDGTKTVETLEVATVNKLLAWMHRAMKLGTEEDPQLVLRVPKWFRKLDEDNVRTGIIEYDLYRRLRDALMATAPHAGLALVIGYHLGMRIGEILSLRWDQINLAKGIITLDKRQTKAKKQRVAPIYGEMNSFLDSALAEHSINKSTCRYVVEYEGQRVGSIKKAWMTACRLCGVKGVRVHDLRRTAATNMIRQGVDVPTIMSVVGWSTPAMLFRYGILGELDARRVAATMEHFIAQEQQNFQQTKGSIQ